MLARGDRRDEHSPPSCNWLCRSSCPVNVAILPPCPPLSTPVSLPFTRPSRPSRAQQAWSSANSPLSPSLHRPTPLSCSSSPHGGTEPGGGLSSWNWPLKRPVRPGLQPLLSLLFQQASQSSSSVFSFRFFLPPFLNFQRAWCSSTNKLQKITYSLL